MTPANEHEAAVALRSTEAGGWWWEVGVPEVSESGEVRAARAGYEQGKRLQQP